MEYVPLCAKINNKYLITVFQGPEISLVQQRTLVVERLVSTTHIPGAGRSEVRGETRGSQNRINIYSNWHTEGFKNLEVCLPVSSKYPDLSSPLPHLHPSYPTTDFDSKPKDLQDNVQSGLSAPR